MRILFVDTEFPRFDRTSSGLRIFTILKLFLNEGCECHYCVVDLHAQLKTLTVEEVGRYEAALQDLGVNVHIGHYNELLRSVRFDCVFFEFFYVAESRIDLVRLFQPRAKVIVDSVDVHFLRLAAKARVTQAPADFEQCELTKQRELDTYSKADVVIGVTLEDLEALKREINGVAYFLIPNIHQVSWESAEKSEEPSLIFIGAFRHEPNVDAVLFFMDEIWPTILEAVPDVRFAIVGGNPPEAIMNLAQDRVEVLGYVPETLPYLQKSWVSIAPLRFGAGMKGKVGEAMAAGVPVVTTSFGAQGLSVASGKEMLIADDPAAFAQNVVRILQNPELREAIAMRGQSFIAENFSPEAISKTVHEFVRDLDCYPIASRLSFRWLRLLLFKIEVWYNERVRWRFRNMSG